MNVNLIVNPIAGNKALRSIKNIEDLLNKKASLTTFITQKKGDAELFAKQIISEFRGDKPPFSKEGQGGDLVIVAGGDGTFNEVINGILSSKESAAKKKTVPLAFIPLGTTNVLAKELNIPENVGKAVHLALTGAAKKISLGRINGRYFALMAGIGFDGEAVLRAKDSMKKISGKEAYIFSGINTLIKYNPSLIEVKTSEGTFIGYTAVVGKANC
ncbi:MAG: diacylglycerol kinase family protein, partial [Nitrospirota bacterium]